ncbi:MAG: hypothetical protein KDE48_19400 [Anaerolineales bacterium]|nr:hypothetical protein [Anaerolineales bacterium]
MKLINPKLLQRSSSICVIILFVVWLCIGCVPQQITTERDFLPVTATPEVITSSQLSTTIPSTSISEPYQGTPTVLQTLIPTTNPFPSPKPTLNRNEEAQLLQELMKADHECKLPCWWGIRLGDSLVSVGNTFTNWGIGNWGVTNNGDKYGYSVLGYYEQDYFSPVDVFLQFYPIDENVEYVQISASHESQQFGEEEFVRDWEQYFLPNFLQTYGKPSLAYLVPGSLSELSTNYFLRLYYPELGLNISYLFRGTPIDNEALEVCFSLKEVTLIDLSLYNPEFADYWPTASLSELGDEYDPFKVENILDMDIETFYEMYQDPNNLDCMQLGR